ncbi:hypothetical protein E7X13_26515, partial [Klebsiella pneumoniae]|nr:hypothetical protein [Klebsiella pneumoniae]
LLLCHGMVCVVGRMRDLILQLSKSSIYSTKPLRASSFPGFTTSSDMEASLQMKLIITKSPSGDLVISFGYRNHSGFTPKRAERAFM